MTTRELISMPIPVTPEDLRRLGTELLVAAQLEPDDARLVADSLVEANLRGIDSHGVGRLPLYLQQLAQGLLEPRPVMKFARLGPALGHLHGNDALGQLVLQRATSEAIALAWQDGAGWVSVGHSSQGVALDYFGLQIARAGMMGFVFTHEDSAPPFCRANPLCITVPGQAGELFCLDLPAGIVSWKLLAKVVLGERVPSGWSAAVRGLDTQAQGQRVRSRGDHSQKAGLSLAIEVLCAMLCDAPGSADALKRYGDVSQGRVSGLVGVIDIARFMALEEVQARFTELLMRWRDIPSLARHGRVLCPGHVKELSKERRLREGILLPASLVAELDELAAAHGLGAWLPGCMSTR